MSMNSPGTTAFRSSVPSNTTGNLNAFSFAMSCVLIRGSADTVTFEATTLDEHLRFEGRGETVAPANQLVPYDLLADALKSADANSAITINPDAISYVTGGANLTVPLPEHKLEDFPPAPVIAGNPIPLPGGLIGSMVEASGCASTDASRYVLNSVNLCLAILAL